ncbi:MAG: hypothetical protein WC460_03575 [Patescibacteria group bacterium]
MENIKPEFKTKEPSVLADEDFKDMIEFRKIRPEDFSIIEELSKFPKNLFILNFHNFFTASKDNTVFDLKLHIKQRETQLESFLNSGQANNGRLETLQQEIKIFQLFLDFAQKYDWNTCDNLNRLLERRKVKKSNNQ